MKKWVKRLLIGLGVLVLLFAVFIGVTVYNDLKQEDILKKEIINFSNKNLLTGDFTVNVETKGDYAYVEEAVKKYFKMLSDSVKSLNSTLTDSSFTTLLAPNNLANDRPSYNNSRVKLKTYKDNIIKNLNKINELCNEENIKNLIDKDKVDDYYYDFYIDLMYTDKDKKRFKELRGTVTDLTDKMNEFLDKADEILVFLEGNDGVIEYKGGKVYFYDNAALAKYNSLVLELQNIALSFADFSNGSFSNDKDVESGVKDDNHPLTET